MIWCIAKEVVQIIVSSCPLKEQIWSIAAPLAQNLEREECPKYPAQDSKSIPGQTKKTCQQNEHLKVSICWKVSTVVPVFKNVGERSATKNYRPVSLLSVVSKVFEKLVNNRIVDHLEKCGLFPDFQYGFRSSRSTAGLLTVVSDRIARALNKSRAT